MCIECIALERDCWKSEQSNIPKKKIGQKWFCMFSKNFNRSANVYITKVYRFKMHLIRHQWWKWCMSLSNNKVICYSKMATMTVTMMCWLTLCGKFQLESYKSYVYHTRYIFSQRFKFTYSGDERILCRLYLLDKVCKALNRLVTFSSF